MDEKYNFKCEVFDSLSNLPDEIAVLIQAAQSQMDSALLLEDGRTYLGCNQENASFPLCMCAERVALYNAGADNDSFRIKALAITAKNPAKPLKEICMPCGACRQVIREFEERQKAEIPLYLSSDGNHIIKLDGISPLLPHSFSKDFLL
jgi:cytidine deaminase